MTRSRALPYRRWWWIGAAACLLIALLASFAVVLMHHNSQAKRDLTGRFATRAALTAGFVRSYIDDFAARERQEGERLLSDPIIDPAAFSEVVASLNLDAAVLLDANGRLLAVWPPAPELLGADLGARYVHLRAAVHGRVGVSAVVPSASERIPIVAVAAPYHSEVGARIFSGAFSARQTPLGAYLESIIPVRGSRAFLLDDEGKNVETGSGLQPLGSGLTVDAVGGLRDRTGSVSHSGVGYTYAIAPVTGSPWHVVLAAPTEGLYSSLKRTPQVDWLVLLAFAIAGVVTVVLLERLGRARGKAAGLARVDVLTGLPNRRAVDEAFVRLAAHATRNGYRLAVLSIDLDHFKTINDGYGHRMGDLALTAVGEALRTSVRAEDIAGRWGGEEFLVVLADATATGTIEAGERLRTAITEAGARAEIPGTLTASIGAAIGGPTDLDSLLRAADAAMYEAKEAGRDRLHLAVDVNAISRAFVDATDPRPVA